MHVRLDRVEWTDGRLCLDGTIHHEVPGDPEVHLLLRERDSRTEKIIPMAVDGVRWRARLEAATLPRGLWDAYVAVAGEAETPLGAARSPQVETSPRRHFDHDKGTVTSYFTAWETLAVDVGAEAHAVPMAVVADTVTCEGPAKDLVVTGHLDIEGFDLAASATLTLKERAKGLTYEVITGIRPGRDRIGLVAEIPATHALSDDPLPLGLWEAWVTAGFASMHRRLPVIAPREPLRVHVWRRWHRLIAVTSSAPDPLTIGVHHDWRRRQQQESR